MLDPILWRFMYDGGNLSPPYNSSHYYYIFTMDMRRPEARMRVDCRNIDDDSCLFYVYQLKGMLMIQSQVRYLWTISRIVLPLSSRKSGIICMLMSYVDELARMVGRAALCHEYKMTIWLFRKTGERGCMRAAIGSTSQGPCATVIAFLWKFCWTDCYNT